MDPTHESTAELLSVAEMFYANNIPLRYIVVPKKLHMLRLELVADSVT